MSKRDYEKEKKRSIERKRILDLPEPGETVETEGEEGEEGEKE